MLQLTRKRLTRKSLDPVYFFRPMPLDRMERRFPLSESPFQHRRKKRRKRRRRTSRTPTEGLFEERLTSAVETSWKYQTGNLCGKAVDLFRWHAADY